MNNNNMITGPTTNPPDLQLCHASPDPHVVFRRTVHTSDDPAWNIHPITTIQPHHQNPRKKRTKMIQFHNTKPIVTGGNGSGPSGSHSSVVTKKKPDPSAPKITRPCTECGKRFWSWKALFGHMRCHPERPWRGINPPPNIHHPPVDNHRELVVTTTEDDEYVAACLLMLANTPTVPQNVNTTTHASTSYQHQHQHHCGSNDMFPGQVNDPESRFECSSCKKVFGSHQALGGHRASHKNVKGCFANTRNDAGTGTGTGTGTEELEYGDYSSHCDKNGEALSINQQHKCSICLKIFSSGQALGGHKRCHLEKEDGVIVPTATATTSVLSQPFRFDLNFPAPLQDDSTCSSSDLDLRLRL